MKGEIHMADTETRQDVVEANIAAVEKKYGDEAWPQIQTQILKDISISLAMLVDSTPSA